MIKSVELKENNFYLLIDFENKRIINNNVLDGLDSKLIVKTDKEVINYVFKNDCPSNYKEFLNDLKEMV